MTAPGGDAPRTRREFRDGAAAVATARAPLARHTRRSPWARLRLYGLLVPSVAIVLAAGAVVGSAFALMDDPERAQVAATEHVELLRVDELPAPQQRAPEPAAAICDMPDVVTALASGDDGAAVRAAGGGEAFRQAVSEGAAPCISLSDPNRLWIIVDKARPFDPIDFAPGDLADPAGVRNIVGASLRAEAASALEALVASAATAGVGEIALESAYRSYRTQQSSYGVQVSARGVDGADLVSARPGYSEHQSGLAVDVVACDGACGTMDELAGTPQGEWIAAHAWEHGWVVRYEDGHTDVTGYVSEPWHLRYVGPDLAAAYHEGGWRTLEEFFGLPAAPDYVE